jgi:hypothetical protein
MAYMNVSAPSDFVQLSISSTALSTSTDFTATATNVITVPALQDITVTNNNGTFRWTQLDNIGRKAAVTPATNSLNFNIVLDPTSFFDGKGTTNGLFSLSNDKVRVSFKFAFGGSTTKYITGEGYLSGLAPKVSPDQPVWLSPLVIEVDGKYNTFFS